MSEKLEKARRFEEKHERDITEEMRPLFHLSPRVGWMNDPNGFSMYKGKYHMFYQYYPYKSQWGPMHWGHAVSDDMLTWKPLPCAIAPDEPYDNAGCFSGSAIELPDGRQLLMYTGVRREEDEDGEIRDIQTQCLAVGDGIDFKKYEGNPVLTEKDLPEGASRNDFRDPKMFTDEAGVYWCVTGNRPADGSGQLLLFRSEDAFHWTYFSTLVENKNRFGKMWECPDFFKLDGKYGVIVSPQDMLPEGLEYHNGNNTLFLAGTYDKEKGKFTEEHAQPIDYGIDFYAPQTISTPDGRKVMIGWMQNWDACAVREPEAPWAGQMSLPREIRYKDGRLYQYPLKELEEKRCDKVEYKDVEFDGEKELPRIEGRMCDLEIKIRPADPFEIYHRFAIHFAEEGDMHSTISYKPHEKVLKVDRKFSGSRRAIVHQRRCQVEPLRDGTVALRIILDRYSAEVFAEDGRKVMSMALYTDISAKGISFISDGKVKIDVTKYTLS